MANMFSKFVQWFTRRQESKVSGPLKDLHTFFWLYAYAYNVPVWIR